MASGSNAQSTNHNNQTGDGTMNTKTERIDRVKFLMHYVKSAAHFGRAQLLKSIAAVQASEPFAELSDLERAAVLGFAAGRVDALDEDELIEDMRRKKSGAEVTVEFVDVTTRAQG